MCETVPEHIHIGQIDVWFQDEARFGQHNTTTRLWAPKGSRPRAVKQQQFEYAYLFGAICPATGATEALIVPKANTEGMRLHLKQISQATPEGRYAAVVVDGASWHGKALENEFDNLVTIKLPPYSPELNPVEQIWQWLRQHHLANRCFDGFEDIVESCSIAWNHFRESTDRVQQMCTREWATLIK